MTALTATPHLGLTHQDWHASLHLRYRQKAEKTILSERRHSGPLLVQKPFYPEGNRCCHTYIIHPPGGIVGGDQLDLVAYAEANAHTLITTPAATKFYRSNGRCAKLNQHITIEPGACVEWLPQETVYFNESIASIHTRIDLAASAQIIAWDIQCLGRPAGNAPFSHGRCIQRLEVYREQRLLMAECNRFQGESDLLSGPFGMQRRQALGTMVVSCDDPALVEELRRQTDWDDSAALVGLTYFNGLIICRTLADFSYQILPVFRTIWQFIRPVLIGHDAVEPRIWST